MGLKIKGRGGTNDLGKEELKAIADE